MRSDDEDDPWDWDYDKPAEVAEVAEVAEEPQLGPPDGNKLVATHTRQRVVSPDGTAMEQTTRQFTIRDLNTALDLITAMYKGSNVFDEIRRAVVKRALARHDKHKDAAAALGISSRMLTYWKQQEAGRATKALADRFPISGEEDQDKWT